MIGDELDDALHIQVNCKAPRLVNEDVERCGHINEVTDRDGRGGDRSNRPIRIPRKDWESLANMPAMGHTLQVLISIDVIGKHWRSLFVVGLDVGSTARTYGPQFKLTYRNEYPTLEANAGRWADGEGRKVEVRINAGAFFDERRNRLAQRIQTDQCLLPWPVRMIIADQRETLKGAWALVFVANEVGGTVSNTTTALTPACLPTPVP